ncbi:MAG TPA: CRISPR-associated endonuclease Cas3'' [Burkholderiales bacterium]|nr:CRISPR-associated endonuclease Cas3'' [Burkholderiales bacterium]
MADAQGEPFWGKVERQGADGLRFLPLASHCLDVAVVFRALLELPVLRRRLESAAGRPLYRAQVERLAVIALLHDVGKANLGFQGKIFDPKAPQIGHIGPLAPLFTETILNQKLAAALNVDRLFSWFVLPEALQGFLLASWSHHGKPVRFDPDDRTGDSRRWWQPDGNRDPFQAIAELTAAAREAFPAAFAENVPPIPGVTRLQHRVAGLVMLADWAGSHQAFFPLERPPRLRRPESRHQRRPRRWHRRVRHAGRTRQPSRAFREALRLPTTSLAGHTRRARLR